ncbi:hypothetical protein CK203_102148 [Vitis vinifera]|uniref:Uncharacterized protein n=1 Tax=Vitis vinifera TaxID=29760 RepID=A0A438ELP1_VITVI|nr:hypothetical protein CK203_102148 [Vitis vinifera]
MGSRVDLSLSKRTRKPIQPQPRRYNLNLSSETGRPSLRQLMDGDAEAAQMVVQSNGRVKKKCSNSLGSRFAEEEEKKQLSLVVKQGKMEYARDGHLTTFSTGHLRVLQVPNSHHCRQGEGCLEMGMRVAEVGVGELVKAGLSMEEAQEFKRILKAAVGGARGSDPSEVWWLGGC